MRGVEKRIELAPFHEECFAKRVERAIGDRVLTLCQERVGRVPSRPSRQQRRANRRGGPKRRHVLIRGVHEIQRRSAVLIFRAGPLLQEVRLIPEALPKSEDDLDHVPHLELLDRSSLRAQVGDESDCAALLARSFPHADGDGEDGRLCADLAAPRSADSYVAFAPFDLRHRRAMPDCGALGIQSASKPGKDRVVSVADPELLVAARIVLFLIGAAQRRRAHPVGVCGVIALHVSQRHLPNSRRQFLRFQKVGEGAIAAGGDARAKAIYLFPEISHPLPSSGTRPPVVVRELVGQQSRRLDDGERGGLLAVDELRSQLDGQGKIRRVQGEDTAAQSLAGFE